MEHAFFSTLNQNTVVLTPNRRLTTHLLSNYGKWQQKQKKITWETANILPLSGWLNNLWQQLHQPSLLLTPNQVLQLWQQVIQNSKASEQILDVSAAAKLAQQAWDYLSQWQQPLAAIQEFANPEIAIFSQWAKDYQKLLQKNNALDNNTLVDQLIKQATQLHLPESILLVGFDEMVPHVQYFLDQLPCKFSTIDSSKQAETSLLGLSNTQTELQTMLRWAQKTHQQQPSAKITCILPQLEQQRTDLVQMMHEVFFPQGLIDSEFNQDCVNISGGISLQHCQIVMAGLQLLQLNSYQIDYPSLSQLLNNAFIDGADTEATQRALLDSVIRDLNEPTLTWRTVLNAIGEYQQKHKNHYGEQLARNIEHYLAQEKDLPKKADCDSWRKHFLDRLSSFGWPGPRNLSSPEHQQVKRFYEALDEFSQLSLGAQQYNYRDALKLLQQLMRNTLFQPQTINGHIQILGLLEAAGLDSDYIWVMGLDSTTWPASANPNPFIPTHLQRQWQMPHGSAERELLFAKKMQQRFMKSCHTLIFSYPKQDGERQLQASTLLKDIPEITLEALALDEQPSPASQIQQNNSVIHFIDNKGPNVQQDEFISGGTGIFKSQAACQFQAFARYRLKARSVSEPELNLSALDRGSLLHLALDSIWSILGDQKKLLATADVSLLAIIQRAIDDAFSQHIPYYSKKIKPRLKALETQRLQQLLFNWLEYEKQRPAFKVIAHEQWRKVNYGNLTVHMQIDRVDQLANEEQLVIDYKTGNVHINDWFGDHPKEPQLPLYATTGENIQALSFAEIKADNLSFKGISSFNSEIPGIKSLADLKTDDIPLTWEALLENWEHTLNNLAHEFNQGLAAVNPQDHACDYCEIASLCRIHEVA